MATCPECKKCYPDRCPVHKYPRQSASYPSSAPSSDPAVVPPPTRRHAADPNSQAAPIQYPKPGAARKKPPRKALSMNGWAGFCTFLGVMTCILSIFSLSLAQIGYSIALLFGSMSLFCLGKLFRCVTEHLKNQAEILDLIDRE